MANARLREQPRETTRARCNVISTGFSCIGKLRCRLSLLQNWFTAFLYRLVNVAPTPSWSKNNWLAEYTYLYMYIWNFCVLSTNAVPSNNRDYTGRSPLKSGYSLTSTVWESILKIPFHVRAQTCIRIVVIVAWQPRVLASWWIIRRKTRRYNRHFSVIFSDLFHIWKEDWCEHYRSTRARDSPSLSFSLAIAIAKNDKKNVHNLYDRENRSNRRGHRSGEYEFPNPSGGYSRNLRSATHADHIVGITEREAEIESSLSPCLGMGYKRCRWGEENPSYDPSAYSFRPRVETRGKVCP